MTMGINQIFKKISPSKSSTLKFGIQGGKGSFNEEALMDYTSRNSITDFETVYLYTTERVLTELAAKNIDYGLFAMHNSTGGIVMESVFAMAAHRFKIVEEFFIVVRHFLHKKEGVPTEKIDTIMSHPQALKQCTETLKKKYPNMEQKSGEKDLIDHAKVAQALHENKFEDSIAVLGPKILSEIYDLEIIDENLQDLDNNLTSFLLVERY